MSLGKEVGLSGLAIAYCVLLVLGTVGSLSAALIWQGYQQSIREITKRAVVHAKSLSYSAEPALLLNDKKALAHVVRGASQEDAVELAQIIDVKGNVLATFLRTGTFVCEAALDPEHPLVGPIGRDSMRVERTANQLLVVVPVWSDSNPSELDLLLDEDDDSSTDNAVNAWKKWANKTNSRRASQPLPTSRHTCTSCANSPGR